MMNVVSRFWHVSPFSIMDNTLFYVDNTKVSAKKLDSIKYELDEKGNINVAYITVYY